MIVLSLRETGLSLRETVDDVIILSPGETSVVSQGDSSVGLA